MLLALGTTLGVPGCGGEIVEPGPSIAVVTGRVTDDAGHGVANTRITIYLDPLDQMPAPGEPHHVRADTVAVGDGSFAKSVLIGGVGPFEGRAVVVATPRTGGGLRTDSVISSVSVRYDPPYDTLTVTIVLTPE